MPRRGSPAVGQSEEEKKGSVTSTASQEKAGGINFNITLIGFAICTSVYYFPHLLKRHSASFCRPDAFAHF